MNTNTTAAPGSTGHTTYPPNTNTNTTSTSAFHPTTGSGIAPTTGTTYETTHPVHTTNPLPPTTTTTTAPGTTHQNAIPTTKQTTNPIKAGLAALHGAGEAIRGTVNGAVDGAFNESGEVTKSNAVTSAGIDEIETGRFAHGTKAREGLVPGGGSVGVNRVGGRRV